MLKYFLARMAGRSCHHPSFLRAASLRKTNPSKSEDIWLSDVLVVAYSPVDLRFLSLSSVEAAPLHVLMRLGLCLPLYSHRDTQTILIDDA